MLYNNLLFFLGIYSWNYKSTNFIHKIFQKKQININLSKNYNMDKNNNLFKFDDTESRSPNLNFYLDIVDLKELDFKLK